MPKIAPNSPLYAQFRQDFPAQAGEGITGDLNYSDTIIPIVDMTAAAGEGVLPSYLQTAWDFSVSTVTANNSTETVANSPGFWQVWGTSLLEVETPPDVACQLQITDGLSTKLIWRHFEESNVTGNSTLFIPQSVVFLKAGETLQCRSSAGGSVICISSRQVATVNGELVNPNGFSFN